MERIEALFEQLNFPGPARLKQALKNRGIPFTNLQVEKLAKGETVRQIQQAAPPLKGRVASHYQHYEWQSDLVDWSTAPSTEQESLPTSGASKRRTQKGPEKKDPEKFILVVQDVFSRKIWAEATVTKQPDEILRAFKRILDKIRDEGGQIADRLTTDAGGEFAGVKKFMGEMNRQYRIRTSQRSLATLDNAIGLLKKALARDLRKKQTDDWAARLQKIVLGQNSIPKDYLDAAEPEDVADDAGLREKLQDKNQNYYDINREQIEERATKLEAAKNYRILLNRGKFNRGWQPN